MIDFTNCTEKELWEYVAVALADKGLTNVLVGGAVAAIYSEGIYTSGDLDFIVTSFISSKSKIEHAMLGIGFKREGRHWVHPDCKHLYVEFCNPPLAIGEDHSIKPVTVVKNGIEIFILSPTDCVKDRLASYIHWNARECLDQALYVARANPINMSEIKRWLLRETTQGKSFFKEFESKL
jgi:hypothetical protein